MRILEGEEQAALGALVGPHLDEILPVEEDLALGDLVRGMPHQRVGERGLARPVRAHHGMDLVEVDRQIDTLDDLPPGFLVGDVQILYLQQSHRSESSRGHPESGPEKRNRGQDRQTGPTPCSAIGARLGVCRRSVSLVLSSS
jgi:hypothetical protein